MAEQDNAAGAAAPAGGGNGSNGGNGGNGNAVAAGTSGALPEPQSGVLSLAQLIGAPIHALVDAEAQSAMATARFVRAVGFTGDGEGMGDLGELQMARFTRKRRNADGTEEDVEVQIPLLSMLPIPALQIKDAELDYTVKIVQTEALPSREAEVNQLMGVKRMGPLREAPATLRAAFARESRPGDRRSVDMLVKMKLRIEQADMPGGLAQLLALATESSRQDRLEPPKPDNGGKIGRRAGGRSNRGKSDVE
jgi:hypothetical protein